MSQIEIQKLRNRLCSFDEEKDQWKYSLIGPEGLDNIEYMLQTVRDSNIRGDFVETGVWQGGACIYAKALIDEYGMNRTVYACDSFKGLPKPESKEDEGDVHYMQDYLAVSVAQVKKNFDSCKVSTQNVSFVEGWFKDTMPLLKNEIKEISVLRLDGDMYDSTMVVLDNLYDRVSVGGFIVIDDYCLPRAIAATNDFRSKRNIKDGMVKVNSCIYYWRKLC